MIDPLRIERRGKPIDLEGLWAPNPAFLVGGGPSLNDVPIGRLRERGVMSLAINNAAAWAPIRAWVGSDTHWKFHHALYLDPAVMTFAPQPKLGRKIHLKVDGKFYQGTARLEDCPNTFGYHRRTRFVPEQFFSTPFAHWGPRGDQPEDVTEQGCLCTMLIGVRLLHYLGVRRVYMIGVDHHGRDGMCYAYPEEKAERNRRYRWERHMLDRLQPYLEREQMELVQCAPDSRCSMYRQVSFADAVEDCKGSVGNEPLDTYGWSDMKAQDAECKINGNMTPKHFERK